MNEPRPRSWSVDERINALTKNHFITMPFTPDERDLARNLAAAFYFWEYQQELPDRALEGVTTSHTPELNAFDMGIIRVKLMREGQIHGPISPATRR